MFLYLFSNWTDFGGEEAKNAIWTQKRKTLRAVDFSSKFGKITVQQGEMYGADERINYLLMSFG
jgi:hypothetical protein